MDAFPAPAPRAPARLKRRATHSPATIPTVIVALCVLILFQRHTAKATRRHEMVDVRGDVAVLNDSLDEATRTTE